MRVVYTFPGKKKEKGEKSFFEPANGEKSSHYLSRFYGEKERCSPYF